jgi:hypothetical protein
MAKHAGLLGLGIIFLQELTTMVGCVIPPTRWRDSWQFNPLGVPSSPLVEHMHMHHLDFSCSFWLLVEGTRNVLHFLEKLQDL